MKKILSVLLIMTLVISSITIAQFGYAANPTETNRYTVLILDTSGSMNGTPASKQKEAAIKFCESMLNSEGNNYIAIVKLNTSSSVGLNFSKDLSALKSYIQNIPASGGTNINQSLTVADALLRDIPASVTAPIKNIVLCSDGLPESGSTNNNGPYTSSEYSGYQYANAVYNTATTLKPSYNIYTLGFFHKLSGSNLNFGRKFMNDIQNAGYYEVTNPDELEFTFEEIAEDISSDNYPVIIIPGIMGSKLYSDASCKPEDRVWPPYGYENMDNMSHVEQALMIRGMGDRLKVSRKLYVKAPVEQSSLPMSEREYGSLDTYKPIVDELCRKHNRDVYFFSYDWRVSNLDNSEKLNSFIKSLNVDKVDLIAHSMGGLVASCYYKSYGSGRINKVITCGTPYEGAPKMINIIQNWDLLDENKLEDEVANVAIGFPFLGGLTKAVKRELPAIAELLPTTDYVDIIPMYRDNWRPFNIGDSTISTKQYEEIAKKIVGSTNYSNSVITHNWITSNNGNYGVLADYENAFFIIGSGKPTMSSIKFQWSNSDIDETLIETDVNYSVKGDGTVPYASATMAEYLNENNPHVKVLANTDHGGTATSEIAIDNIMNVLQNGTFLENDIKPQGKKYIVVRIACPVEVKVTKNNETLSSGINGNFSALSSFGRIDILGENDEIKMLCLEESDEYTIDLLGTDTGTMDFTIRWFDEEGDLLEERYVENVPVTKGMVATTTTSNSETNSVIAIDRDGDGETDSEVIVNSKGGSYDLNALLKKLMDVFKTILELFLKIVISLVNTNVEANESAAA